MPPKKETRAERRARQARNRLVPGSEVVASAPPANATSQSNATPPSIPTAISGQPSPAIQQTVSAHRMSSGSTAQPSGLTADPNPVTLAPQPPQAATPSAPTALQVPLSTHTAQQKPPVTKASTQKKPKGDASGTSGKQQKPDQHPDTADAADRAREQSRPVGAPACTDTNTQQSQATAKKQNEKIGIIDKGTPFPAEDHVQSVPDKFLLANHFQIFHNNCDILYEYDLEFLREETDHDRKIRDKLKYKPLRETLDGFTHLALSPARPKRKRIMWLLMERLIQENPETRFATDYFGQIISSVKLPNDAADWSEKITYRDEFSEKSAGNADVFRVKFVQPKILSLSELFGYLRTGSPADYNKQLVTSALNTIFSYGPFQKCFQKPNQPVAESAKTGYPRLTTRNGNKFYGIAKQVPPTSTATDQSTAITDTGNAQLIVKGTYVVPGVVTIPGFARSVRPTMGQQALLTLNVNIGTSIFYQHADSLQDLINLWRKGKALTAYTTIELNSFLKNIYVCTKFKEVTKEQDYIGRVTGLADPKSGSDEPNPSKCMMYVPGGQEDKTVANYFRLINDASLVVNLGEGRNRHTVPADLLKVIPGQFNRNTNEKPAAGIRDPKENRDLLEETGPNLFLETIDTQAVGARDFGLDLDRHLLRVPFRQLKTPEICYLASVGEGAALKERRIQRARARGRQPEEPEIAENGKITVKSARFEDQLIHGSWNLAHRCYVAPASEFRWTYVELRLRDRSACPSNQVKDFERLFAEAISEVGMTEATFVKPASGHVQELDRYLPNYQKPVDLKKQEDKIKVLFNRLKKNDKVDAVILLLPESNQDLYSAIKRMGDQEVGITTICHATGKPGKPSIEVKTTDDFLTNLTMKLNLKVKPGTGTANHELEKKGQILETPTLVLGVDVTHPGGLALKYSPSVSAVVGNIDLRYAHWPATLAPLEPDRENGKQAIESVTTLKEMVTERFEAFYRKTDLIPAQVVVYRDGLSEEQFEMCRIFEFARIRKGIDQAIKKLRKNKPTDKEKAKELEAKLAIVPKILLICAVKRHHTRCYPRVDQVEDDKVFIGPVESKEGTKYNWNPLPGTMITHGVTYGTGRDFYLYSQNAIKGTARPTHYVILRDEIGCCSEDVAQMVSYTYRGTRES